MALFRAIDPSVEVSGSAVLAVVAGLRVFRINASIFLSSHGIVDPKPQDWYPQQAWLDAFQALCSKLGANILFHIGKAVRENALFPEPVHSIEDSLASIDVAYHMNHRGGEIGSYAHAMTGERGARFVCRNPYPCDFDRGIIYAAVDKIIQPAVSTQIEVSHESETCRMRGSEECVYKVSW